MYVWTVNQGIGILQVVRYYRNWIFMCWFFVFFFFFFVSSLFVLVAAAAHESLKRCENLCANMKSCNYLLCKHTLIAIITIGQRDKTVLLNIDTENHGTHCIINCLLLCACVFAHVHCFSVEFVCVFNQLW